MFSTVKPKRFCSSAKGAEAPNPFMQTRAPDRPVQRSQPKELACSTATRAHTSGGSTVTITGSSQTGGTYTLVGNDLVFTASGGTIGPFRYADLYNDTPTSPADPLIQFLDYGSNVAGPVVRRVMEQSLAYLGVPPSPPEMLAPPIESGVTISD